MTYTYKVGDKVLVTSYFTNDKCGTVVGIPSMYDPYYKVQIYRAGGRTLFTDGNISIKYNELTKLSPVLELLLC